ncbi:hypothetical protein PoB_007126000 [Plakobranchus ocellatus]|uniref:Uncharacterized protein n=1 Tax=Plakobranchus ocellatus TaxID=259542 RepID=A0AAV4DKT3_9GAST|nr:hypothetical protein PoB_007126000 [Plakobranchus ocellatus]
MGLSGRNYFEFPSHSVPVIPALLVQQDRREFDNTHGISHTHNTSLACPIHGSWNSSALQGGSHPPVFSLTSVAVAENSRVGWLLCSKAIVQLCANFVVGSLCNSIALASQDDSDAINSPTHMVCPYGVSCQTHLENISSGEVRHQQPNSLGK